MRIALAPLLLAAILAPAYAQDEPPVSATATWDDDIRSVFIGETAGDLRPEPEMRKRWAALPADLQALVRQDCDATRNGDAEGSDPNSAPVKPPEPTTGSIEDQPGVLSLSELVRICRLVDGF